ncbi:MAG: porphobilinogen synthase [SAR86 cluster bacterium]|uniref:Delta-aminolevulinic acid dehydratase n=1 Tax=SAR86 cluster bacterium TaxID=2030880 RepID=A0A520MRI1_9GAMM|nr:MAG: porphobilinogen synthase [SAR86 cluster bacterium]|tara:strand:+ start:1060 stop:2055 length:996 start_codon:yes stop_codon:yes gene_type:complete
MLNNLFPKVRPRRLRKNKTIRDLVSETKLFKSKLIQPLFVSDSNSQKIEIEAMPGQYVHTKETLFKEVDELLNLGIKTIALFPNISKNLKDSNGTEALNPENFLCGLVSELKNKFPELILITDVALDPYTDSGHDGIIIGGEVDNDETLKSLESMSLNLAHSGSDIIAPSDMMDGRVGIIRKALEAENLKNTIILSYSAKYASNFYGPFRDAVGSKQTQGISKDSYQMDKRNLEEALKEARLDLNEGADILMVKPGMPYLDVIREISSNTDAPIFAYQVSGEYSMLQLGIDKKIFKHNVIPETLISLFRAGSSSVITYYAKWVAENYDDIS